MNKENVSSEPEIVSKRTGIVFESDRKKIERYSILAMLCLIAAVILISFNIRLVSGSLVIIAAATGVLIIRKANSLLSIARESLKEASSSSEKKDDVITDFSHRISYNIIFLFTR